MKLFLLPLWLLCVFGQMQAARAAAPHDGAHDFDFSIGTWHTHIKRNLDPFDEKSAAIELDGTVTTRSIWNGGGHIEEIEADGPRGHWEGMGLFLYNPAAHQWNQYFAGSKAGAIAGTPFTGSFENGQAELVAQDTFNDRSILVRARWFDIAANSHSYEEDFSEDGGKNWKLSFRADKTRL